MVRPVHNIVAAEPMTPGRDTLASIEQSIQDLRQREADLQRDLETTNEERARVIEQRLAAFRELAEVRARHALSDGVIDEADRLSARVANLLIARQKTIRDLRVRNRDADSQRAELLVIRDELGGRIEALEKELDELALKAREALSGDSDYRRELAEFGAARKVLDKARDKARRAATDRVEKGRDYETDPLFMYLWRRKYGSAEYAASNIIKWLDAKVADLVGYHGARANYAVLLEIPVRLADHVERLAERLREHQETVDARETDKIKELAGTDLAAQLRTSRAEQDANLKAFEATSGELSDIGEQLNRYAEGRDPAFHKAVELSAEFLSQERTDQLMRLARLTTTPSDDQIVARIANLDERLARATEAIDKQTGELERLFDKRDELVRIAADFRRARYDDPASVFRGNDVAQILLEELIRGAITGAEYWARTRRRQSWRRRPADSYRRSESFPPFDDSIFGGSWDGGDSWSGGGDDFETGGSF